MFYFGVFFKSYLLTFIYSIITIIIIATNKQHEPFFSPLSLSSHYGHTPLVKTSHLSCLVLSLSYVDVSVLMFWFFSRTIEIEVKKQIKVWVGLFQSILLVSTLTNIHTFLPISDISISSQ